VDRRDAVGPGLCARYAAVAVVVVERERVAAARLRLGLRLWGRGLRPGLCASGLDGWGARTLYIEPGPAWENGYIKSFNGKLRDELLDREVFYTLLEVTVLTERYRRTCNHTIWRHICVKSEVGILQRQLFIASESMIQVQTLTPAPPPPTYRSVNLSGTADRYAHGPG